MADFLSLPSTHCEVTCFGDMQEVEMGLDSKPHWFLGTLGDYSCSARAICFPPLKKLPFSLKTTMQPAPASQPPPCLPALGSAVRHNSTVKVRCMLKRHGLIFPENPALLEALWTHLCTQLFQATTSRLEVGNGALEATNPKYPEFSLHHPPNSRHQRIDLEANDLYFAPTARLVAVWFLFLP